jgi:hypothetical protein
MPMLLIVAAIVSFGSIVARADGIDTEHLFGFTLGTDVGELGERSSRAICCRALARVPAPIPRCRRYFLGIYGEPESSSRSERRRRLS